jgi:hypothetical protein
MKLKQNKQLNHKHIKIKKKKKKKKIFYTKTNQTPRT